MKISTKHSIVLFSLLFLLSCSGGPGGPLLRTASDDGEGDILLGCKNVSSKSIVTNYITGYYLTTWGSAYSEGMQQGVYEGLPPDIISGIESVLRSAGISTKPIIFKGIDRGDILISLISRPLPFCRYYSGDSKNVSGVIGKIVQNLGNKILVSDVESGVFITDFIMRQHENKLAKYPPRWLDRYEITVKSQGKNKSVVTIFRDIYISREPHIYNQSVSVGHNEGWIMSEIDKHLTNKSLRY